MKTRFPFIALLLLGFIGSGCEDDNDNIKVDSLIESAFSDKYPSVSRVEWERKGAYYVAEFYFEQNESEAWFDDEGNWCMTDTDIPYEQLPEAVKDKFSSDVYKSWHIDDIDKIERADKETTYVLEVEKGHQEYNLYYSEDGSFIKQSGKAESVTGI